MDTLPDAPPTDQADDADAQRVAAKERFKDRIAAIELAEARLAAVRREAADELQCLRGLGVSTRGAAAMVGRPESTLRYQLDGQRATRTGAEGSAA